MLFVRENIFLLFIRGFSSLDRVGTRVVSRVTEDLYVEIMFQIVSSGTRSADR